MVKLALLARALDDIDPTAEVHVVMEHLTYIDHACLELRTEKGSQRETTGSKLNLEREEVEARSNMPLLVRTV